MIKELHPGDMYQTVHYNRHHSPRICTYSEYPPKRTPRQFNPRNYQVSFIVLGKIPVNPYVFGGITYSVFLTARPGSAKDSSTTVSLKCIIYHEDIEDMHSLNYLEKVA